MDSSKKQYQKPKRAGKLSVFHLSMSDWREPSEYQSEFLLDEFNGIQVFSFKVFGRISNKLLLLTQCTVELMQK